MGELAIEASEEGAKKEAERSAAHQSGRYSIGQPREDQTARMSLQPTAANENGLSVHQISEEELAWIEERTQTSRRPEPKPSSTPPATVFHKPASEDDPPTLSALRPYYREPTLERVQLQFEDKSLDPTQNPLAHSSLQPPQKRRFAGSHSLLTGVGALALVGVGYLAALANTASEPVATTTFAPASAPAQTALPPSDPEPEVAAPTAAAAPQPALAVAQPQTDVPWSVADRPSQPDAQLAAAAPQTGVEQPGVPPQADTAQPRRVPRAHVVARPTPASTAGLPPLPSREQIQAGIEGMRATLQTCAGATHGTTTARLTILGTGRVASATIEGAFAGSAQGSCMARALRTATFPRFAAENLQVTYPFRL